VPRLIVVIPLIVAITATAPVAAQRARSTGAAPAATEAFAALEQRRFGDALDGFTAALKTDPRNPDLLIGAGVSALMLGNNADAERWLERAIGIAPRIPEAYVFLGEARYRSGKLAEAIAALETGTQMAPDNRELQERLERWRAEARTEERFFQSQSAHFAVRFEGAADEALARRATEILEAAYWRIGAELSTYPTRTIEVILYTAQQFRDITRAPEWAGGISDGRIKVPIQGASNRIAELERVLSHELVHATVATIAGPTVPVWLNEGLATALEPGGMEWARHQLDANTARLPFARLGRGFAGLSSPEASAAYAQSALAVRKLMELRSPSAVVNLLQAIGRGVPFETAFQQAVFISYQDFSALMAQQW
jgi:tetratricopeptide (TPR) repeat protein